uniref:HS12B protein n=1 Tax=Poecilia formosa TaxID=48698 RepID=A0A096LUW0_POEFO
VQNLQMALFHTNKEELLKVLYEVMENLRPLTSECYWLSCLMALNNPPLQPDWKNLVPSMDPCIKTNKYTTSLSMGDSFVIAIDFGTAFSGYAFNITPRGEKSEPHLPRWGKEYGFDSPKTPTCILFNEDETCLSFGYEAKMKYKEMSREEAKKHYYFEDFKMALYSKKLSSNLEIKAANGKSMKALKVFSESLRFLKEDALRTISRNTEGKIFFPSDFTWVLTVPAIWDPSAKQFMREAATQ